MLPQFCSTRSRSPCSTDARRQHLELFPLFRAVLTLAVNPVVIKAALQLAGKDTGELRLCEMPAEDRAALKALLKRHVPDAVAES